MKLFTLKLRALKYFPLFATLLFAMGAQANGLNIKPGLWEIQNQMNMNGQQMPDMHAQMAEAQKHMAELQSQMGNMPPEMQERMKAAMSQNNRMGMTDKGMTICMTQEQIDRAEINQDPNNHCKMTDMQQSGNKTTIKMHCDTPHEANMMTEVMRLSDTEWQSTSHMTSGQRTIDTTAHGKWLKADCGDIKPLTGMKK